MIFFYLILSFSLVNSSSVYLFFERTTIELSLSESIEIHSKLSSIQAQASSSLSIVYRLHGDTDQTFFLNTQTGELYLRKSLDYETQPIYKLTIEARAATATSIVAPCFTQLIIYIVNINDNPPDINLVIYPSVLYESDIIKYDLNSPLTHFATIYIKDLDESTENLTLTINNTDDFQVQLIRRMKTSLVYILSIRTHGQYLKQEDFYISMNTCDNDQPLLCTNRTYRFQFRSNEYLCNLSFNQKTYIIDIDEHLPNRSLIMKKMTNKFCENLTFSIDDNENFSMDFQTGDLYTLKRFNRLERSIYVIHLFINNLRKIKIIVRLLDQFGKIPFLFNKNLVMNVETFSTIQIFNSTFCRSQSMMENYFQLLSNCTIRSLTKPLPQGQYLFQIELFQHTNYRDTFLLELRNEQIYFLAFKQLQWFVIVSICLSMIGILGIILIIKYKRSRFNQRSSPLSIEDDSYYNRFDGLTTTNKLKVHDEQELSSSQTNPPIYLIGKTTTTTTSSMSAHKDDEGYSGSSDVSENHGPYETTVISANELLEQYRVHEFHKLQSTIYDVPRRSVGDASLV